MPVHKLSTEVRPPPFPQCRLIDLLFNDFLCWARSGSNICKGGLGMLSVLLCYAHLWCCKVRYLPFLWPGRMTCSIIKRTDSSKKPVLVPNGRGLLSGLRRFRGRSSASDVDDWEGGTLVAGLWVTKLFWVFKSRAVWFRGATSLRPHRRFRFGSCSPSGSKRAAYLAPPKKVAASESLVKLIRGN